MNSRHAHQVRLEVEPLEDRQLLAGHILSGPPVPLERPLSSLHAPTAKAAEFSEDVRQIVDFTNDYRRSKGRKPLKVNRLLTLAAQRHANRLAHSRTLGDHGDPHVLHGQTVWDRVRAAGYNAKGVGENIYFSFGFVLTPEETATPTGQETSLARGAVDGWIASRGHRANLLDRRFAEVGIGIATRIDGEFKFTIIVQNFGVR